MPTVEPLPFDDAEAGAVAALFAVIEAAEVDAFALDEGLAFGSGEGDDGAFPVEAGAPPDELDEGLEDEAAGPDAEASADAAFDDVAPFDSDCAGLPFPAGVLPAEAEPLAEELEDGALDVDEELGDEAPCAFAVDDEASAPSVVPEATDGVLGDDEGVFDALCAEAPCGEDPEVEPSLDELLFSVPTEPPVGELDDEASDEGADVVDVPEDEAF